MKLILAGMTPNMVVSSATPANCPPSMIIHAPFRPLLRRQQKSTVPSPDTISDTSAGVAGFDPTPPTYGRARPPRSWMVKLTSEFMDLSQDYCDTANTQVAARLLNDSLST
jgi:hypothetical protein